MSKKNKKSAVPGQLNIFDLIREVEGNQKSDSPPAPGRFDIDLALRELISRSLKSTTLCRYEVAAVMSKLLARDITKSQIDSWSAESKENHRFPLAYLPALVEATGDTSLLRLVCERSGGHFIEGEDALRMELGRIQEKTKELKKKEKTICNFLASLSTPRNMDKSQ